MVNQKESVFNCIKSVKEFEVGNKVVLNQNEKETVIEMLCVGFETNSIEMSERGRKKYVGNRVELRKYVVGLLNNWLRKDLRLNGNEKYKTKNPGSRVSDSVLKNLKLLKQTLSDDDEIKKVDEVIEKRKNELSEKKKVLIDLDKIPVELRKELGLDSE